MIIYRHRTFEKTFKKIPEKIKNQFKDRLRLFLVDPYNEALNNHYLSGKYRDFRSINVSGDYRALFKIENQVIKFYFIGTHAQLYD